MVGELELLVRNRFDVQPLRQLRPILDFQATRERGEPADTNQLGTVDVCTGRRGVPGLVVPPLPLMPLGSPFDAIRVAGKLGKSVQVSLEVDAYTCVLRPRRTDDSTPLSDLLPQGAVRPGNVDRD